MAAQGFKLELNIETTDTDEPMDFAQELLNRLVEVLKNEYSTEGTDLMGYEGPFVTVVNATATD